jgi:hypothetical protein
VTAPAQAPLKALGFLVDPLTNSVRFAPDHMQSLVRATQEVLAAPLVSGKRLSEVLGKWVWAMLICRPALSVFSAAFAYARRFESKPHPLWPSVRSELSLACALAPLLFATVSPLPCCRLVATDASSSGGAVMQAPASPPLVRALLASPLAASPSPAALVSASSSSLVSPPQPPPPAQPHTFYVYEVSPSSLLGVSVRRVTVPRPRPTSSPAPFEPSSSIYALSPPLLRELRRARWRPVFHYPWQVQEHINVLELHAVLSAVRWLLTFPSLMDCGVVLCVDSAVVCYALAKGRSSSFGLLRPLRQLAAFCLASGLVLRPFWLRSADNPADTPSRAYQQQQQQLQPRSQIELPLTSSPHSASAHTLLVPAAQYASSHASFSYAPLPLYSHWDDVDDDCLSDSDDECDEYSAF